MNRAKPVCPDCGELMVKTAIQCSDCSGWMVGWLCECTLEDEDIELVVHAEKDWTASILLNEEEE